MIRKKMGKEKMKSKKNEVLRLSKLSRECEEENFIRPLD